MNFTRDEGDVSGASLPEYVRKQPWYFNTDNTSIDHQRIAPFAEQPKCSIDSDNVRKIQKKQEIVKWKPGCCKNCGSSSHKEQDCLERPKKRNAQITGIGIATRREVSSHRVEQSYEAKRDQYANYDTKRWRMEVSGQFRMADQVRARAAKDEPPRQIEIQEQYGHTHFRDRQDTAAYLGLTPQTSDENWVKADTAPLRPERPPALPREEDLTVDQLRRRREFAETQKMLAEIDEDDNPIAESVPKTKYGDLEDRHFNGHVSVFGSYFCDGKWGYACCRQTDKNSFCTATHP